MVMNEVKMIEYSDIVSETAEKIEMQRETIFTVSITARFASRQGIPLP
jgi:hypothetical protein